MPSTRGHRSNPRSVSVIRGVPLGLTALTAVSTRWVTPSISTLMTMLFGPGRSNAGSRLRTDLGSERTRALPADRAQTSRWFGPPGSTMHRGTEPPSVGEDLRARPTG